MIFPDKITTSISARFLRGEYIPLGLTIAFISLFLFILGPKLIFSTATFAGLAVLVLCATLMFIDFKLVLLLFVAFLFSYEEFDITSRATFISLGAVNSIPYVKIFGIAILDFLTIVFLGIVCIREWAHAVRTGQWRFLKTDALLVPLALILVYGAINGAFHTLTPDTWSWDMRDLGQVMAFYIIFSRTFDSRKGITLVFLVGAGVFLLKNVYFLKRFVEGGGMSFGAGYTRILLGSDMNLTAVFLVISVALFVVYNTAPTILRTLFLAACLYFTIMLLVGLGRLTYILTALALVMTFVLNRRSMKTSTGLTLVGSGVLGAFIFYFIALDQTSRDIISYALHSAFDWWTALRLYGDMSLGTRLLEIINIWETLDRSGAILWGLGWGAPWREVAILQPFDGGASPLVEQLSGIHTQAHIDAVKFLLKIGLIGTVILYFSFFRFWRLGVQLYHLQENRVFRVTLLGLLILLVIIVPNYVYFIRLKILLGFALAGIAVFERNTVNHE